MAEAPSISGNLATRQNSLIALLLAAIALVGVGVISRYALLVVILDGLRAATIVVPWALAGLWLIPLLRLGAMPLRWHLLLGFGLGVGFASVAVLLLGSLGVLDRWIWLILLFAALFAGAIRLGLLLNATYIRAKLLAPRRAMTPFGWRAALLTLSPLFIMALLAASTPSGLIWSEEGFGYDILEYHLQVPKEYLGAGRINYLPHNVYANFPSNVEMLYLLAMVVYPDAREASTIANLIHLGFAVFTVFAAWVGGRELSPYSGLVGAILMGTTGWLVYLSGLAYVENGLLFFGMASLACLLRAYRMPQKKEQSRIVVVATDRASSPRANKLRGNDNELAHPRAVSWLLAGGLFGGFACGCKYTGLAFVLLPFLAAIWVMAWRRWKTSAVHGLVFLVAGLVSLSPWLIKNSLNTGNPVFPLANAFFNGTPAGWTEEETRHWDVSHQPSIEESRKVGRFSALLKHSLLDSYQRLNIAALLLAILGLTWRKLEAIDAALFLILCIQLVIWLTATHWYARFLIPITIPVVLLAARSLRGEGAAILHRSMAIVIIAAAWYTSFAAALMLREWPGAAPASIVYEGRIPAYVHFGWINELPPGSKTLLIGEARAFYFAVRVDYWTTFNRNPFFEQIRRWKSSPTTTTPATGSNDLVRWLQERNYTHLLVNWSEVRRLTRTYGFAPAIEEQEIREAITALEQAGLATIKPQDGSSQSAFVLYSVPSE